MKQESSCHPPHAPKPQSLAAGLPKHVPQPHPQPSGLQTPPSDRQRSRPSSRQPAPLARRGSGPRNSVPYSAPLQSAERTASAAACVPATELQETFPNATPRQGSIHPSSPASCVSPPPLSRPAVLLFR